MRPWINTIIWGKFNTDLTNSCDIYTKFIILLQDYQGLPQHVCLILGQSQISLERVKGQYNVPCGCGSYISRNPQPLPVLSRFLWKLNAEAGSSSLTTFQVSTHTHMKRRYKKGIKRADSTNTDLEREPGQQAH